jgi:hypothetical protein
MHKDNKQEEMKTNNPFTSLRMSGELYYLERLSNREKINKLCFATDYKKK